MSWKKTVKDAKINDTPSVKIIIISKGIGKNNKARLNPFPMIATSANRGNMAKLKFTSSDNIIEITKIVFGR